MDAVSIPAIATAMKVNWSKKNMSSVSSSNEAYKLDAAGLRN
jgi:hypothetical protein